MMHHVSFLGRMLIILVVLSGNRSVEDPTVSNMLQSGIVKPPSIDDDDRLPRAAG